MSGSQRIYISSAAWQALSRTLIRRWFLVQTSGAQRIYLVPIKCLVQQLSPGLSSSGGLHALLLLHSLPCTTPTLLHAPLSLSLLHTLHMHSCTLYSLLSYKAKPPSTVCSRHSSRTCIGTIVLLSSLPETLVPAAAGCTEVPSPGILITKNCSGSILNHK